MGESNSTDGASRDHAAAGRRSGPVEQSVLSQCILPLIRDAGERHAKWRPVHARPATTGETVVSHTSDGEETTNVARNGDMVVQNQTPAREQYLVSAADFDERYEPAQTLDGEWARYEPTGEVRALAISLDVTERLGVDDNFTIEAPWGSEQRVRAGDYFVSPLPKLDQVYRISRREFHETYRPAGDEGRDNASAVGGKPE